MRLTLMITSLIAATPLAAQHTTLTLSSPMPSDGIYMDTDGRLYAAGGGSNKLFMVDDAGTVTVLSTALAGAVEVVRGRDGRLFATEYNTGRVVSIGDDGSVTTVAQLPGGASGLALGPDGMLYAALFGRPNGDGEAVYRIRPDGTVEPFAVGQGIRAPVGLAFDDEQHLWVANAIDGKLHRISPAGEVKLVATLPRPQQGPYATGHIAWANGNLYASGNFTHRVYRISIGGVVDSIAGTGKAGSDGGAITVPNGLTVNTDGSKLFVISGRGIANRFINVIDLDR